MEPEADTRSTRIAGRVRERGVLETALEQAATHRPSAVFVHGEAGVGKTRLVSDVCDFAENRGFVVLWGSCVRFGATTAPYAPLVTALEHWLSRTDMDMSDVLSGARDLGALLPSLDRIDDGGPEPRLVPVIDKVIGRICAHQPVVLVIDDIHWADVTSLDVLAYLLSGFHAQPLLLITTSRDEELGPGHPLHGWLADMRRLPSVHEMHLRRLSRADTEEQIAGLFRSAPDPVLVEEVFARSAGNAYLTELLVRNLDPAATRLPAGLPTVLREALLAAWHRLPSDARRVVQILAVGGRPLAFDDLAAVALSQGISGSVLSESLATAVDSGVVVADTSGEVWFRHPLLAEVLYATLVPGEAARLHTAFVRRLEAGLAAGTAGEPRRLAELALHHELAGDLDDAFRYAVGAADDAARVQAYAEQANQLGRAVQLWPRVGPDVQASAGDLVALLRRASDAANRAGDDESALAHTEHALRILDRTASPRPAARLLCGWCGLIFRSGRVGLFPLAEAQDALALTVQAPDSTEHVQALATVAEAECWHGDLDAARAHSDLAMESAARCGTPEATAWALASRAFVRMAEPSAPSDAEEACRIARASGHEQIDGRAAVWWSNALRRCGRLRESADVAVDAFEWAAATRPAASVTAVLAGKAADRLLDLGDLPSASVLVREGLAVRTRGLGAARVRLSAARVAVLTGRIDEATQHLHRAEEQVPSLKEHVGLDPQPTYAAWLLAQSRPAQAADLLRRAMPGQAMNPQLCDEMLMWGARTAADLAETARDHHDEAGVADAWSRLDELVDLRAGLGDVPFEGADAANPLQTAFQAIFAAETARCRATSDSTERWQQACLSSEQAGMRWEEAMACRRWAQALITQGGRRTEIAMLLRRAHRIAAEIGAEPLRQEVAALAEMTRVSLLDPAPPLPRDEDDGELAGVTPRELDVLSQLVTGRSNTEIGAALFISDKTVSVHVSNLLRKTGTTNRHDLSALARRLGIEPAHGAGGRP